MRKKIEKIKKGEILALVYNQKKRSRVIKFYHLSNNKWENCTIEILRLAKLIQPNQTAVNGLPIEATGWTDTSDSLDAVADILRAAGGLSYLDKVSYKLV